MQRAVAVRWRGVRDFRIESRAHSSDPPPRVSNRARRHATGAPHRHTPPRRLVAHPSSLPEGLVLLRFLGRERRLRHTCHGRVMATQAELAPSLKEAQPPRAPSACACAWRPASPSSPGPDRRAAPTYTSCGRVIGRSRTTQATGSACHLSSSSAALEMSFWTVTMPM